MSAPGPNQPEDVVDDPGEDVIIETPMLNKMCEASAPTPGDFCNKVVHRIRMNVRNRRTENAISRRVANEAITPVMDAFEGELSERIKRTIERRRRNR